MSSSSPPILSDFKQGIDLLVIISLEKEADFSWERMQALKIMKKILDLAPRLFPIGFARSLVAIAAEKGDNFRRVALETLRELGIKNSGIAYEADAFRVLFDAVIDPTTSELSETILLSMLYLLNSAETRKFVRPQLDLQCLVCFLLLIYFDLCSCRHLLTWMPPKSRSNRRNINLPSLRW
jgi:hypothetical protein